MPYPHMQLPGATQHYLAPFTLDFDTIVTPGVQNEHQPDTNLIQYAAIHESEPAVPGCCMSMTWDSQQLRRHLGHLPGSCLALALLLQQEDLGVLLAAAHAHQCVASHTCKGIQMGDHKYESNEKCCYPTHIRCQ